MYQHSLEQRVRACVSMFICVLMLNTWFRVTPHFKWTIIEWKYPYLETQLTTKVTNRKWQYHVCLHCNKSRASNSINKSKLSVALYMFNTANKHLKAHTLDSHHNSKIINILGGWWLYKCDRHIFNVVCLLRELINYCSISTFLWIDKKTSLLMQTHIWMGNSHGFWCAYLIVKCRYQISQHTHFQSQINLPQHVQPCTA